MRTVEVGRDVETTSLMGGNRLRHGEKTGREGPDTKAFKILASDDRFGGGGDLNANSGSVQAQVMSLWKEI